MKLFGKAFKKPLDKEFGKLLAMVLENPLDRVLAKQPLAMLLADVTVKPFEWVLDIVSDRPLNKFLAKLFEKAFDKL